MTTDTESVRIELSILNNMINNDVNLELKPFSSLTINKEYRIKNLSVLNTRYGKAILGHLCDENENIIFKTFLPKRVIEYLKADLLEKINSANTKYTLTYLGQGPSSSGARSKSLVKFDITE